jgi:hypothetical protein
MGTKLLLEDITEGQPFDLGILDAEPVVIGREPDYGIRLASEAVSGEHGIFVPARGHWFYKDLGSTNGSWVNGMKLDAGKMMLVRGGDEVQAADRILRLGFLEGGSTAASRSVIIFSREEVVEEFLIPQLGRAVVIGGSKADLKLDVDVHELPSLVVESRGDSVVAYSVAKETTAYHNGKPFERAVQIEDRDELVVENYKVVVNIPPFTEVAAAEAPERMDDQAFMAAGKTVVTIPFGRQAPGEQRDSFAWGAGALNDTRGGTDVHPSMRRGIDTDSPPSLDILEDKIIIIIGSVLLIGLLGLLIVWAFLG